MNDSTAVRIEIQDGLATVTLSQPARGNPFDGAFVKGMKDVFLQLWETEGLRAVLLRADGANFSFGGDLKTFYPQRASLAPIVRSWTADLHMGLQRAWQLPVPIVAEVQGFAMGGAVALLAGADVVVAGQSTKIGSAFSQIGFSCDSGTTVTLTARMGAARAKRFVMLAEVLSSEEARQAGLVDKVVSDESLSSEALALARKLAVGPTVAYGEVKRLFHRASAIQMEALLEDEALTLARVAGTQDAQEGIAAMVEKRKPFFQGR
ncbi:MAG: enoyl-CoA hydratase/isomerase family protein [Burkholderiaceae bacterium]